MHGYSSSSETDDEYNYRKHKGTVQTTTNSNDANKKKKKRKLPPQQSINRIWKRFSNKRFNKALSVLPFDPVLPPVIPERSNEPFSAGYDRAVEECRRKVKKIIQECRRVNMRYRDPGWDIDWDLKMEKGNCLNSLGRTKYDLSMSNMLNPSSVVPKAVKRVHEIFEKPTFMENISGSDVKQGNLGDCWLMSSLSGLASVPDGIKRICVEYDTRIGIYGFVFYRDGEWIYSIIDDKLYLKSPCWDSPSMQRDLLQQIDREDVERVYRKTYQTGSKALFFAQCKDQNETWLPLLEKAYAKAHGDFACLSGGWIGEGLEDLSGGVTTELLASDILDLDGFWDNELSRVNEEFLFGCSTGLLDGGYGDRDGISEGHAYVIMEARTLKNGTRLLKLRNPWGKNKKGLWEGAWSDGSKEWTTEVQEELGHQFGSDSVFWISYEDLLRKYQHFDRTRLFREPDWRCCQRWIGVEVPWKPQFNEKFHFKLTRDSPLVLVLSQLDNRYFRGLQGQYTFRLHFRLHEKDRPDAEDYIVRSHGNYLMYRSVSIELPNMPPGEYSVFISVIGERDTDVPSIENVVKRECKGRVENEKLAQVGYAYDLAHSKAAAHLDAVKKLRKKADQKKASDARVKERHRLWEKRHLNREITKMQGRKNNQKLEARQAAREEKKKKEEEIKKKEEEEKRKVEEEKKKKEEEEKKKEEEAKKKEEEEKKRQEEEKRKQDEELKPKDKGVQTEEPAQEDKKAGETAGEEKAQDKTDETKAAEDSKSQAESKSDETKTEPQPDSQSKEAKDDIKVGTSTTGDEDAAADDTSSEGTPIHTPTESPVDEKTEEEASSSSGDKSASTEQEGTDGSTDTKADDKTQEESKPDEKESKADDKSAEDKVKSEEKSEAPAKPNTEDKTGEQEGGEVPSAASSDTTGTPQMTPKTEASSTPATEEKEKEKVPVPPVDPSKVSGGPPPATTDAAAATTDKAAAAATSTDAKPAATTTTQPAQTQAQPQPQPQQKKKPANMYVTSDGESSASPISDWEELYSSDDMTRKPRMSAPPAPGTAVVSKYRDETEDENEPDPWNAICVVGLRVYSKDEDLELRVVMEGGELEEGGMGEKGGPDLDNAQANAGGARGPKRAESDHEQTAAEEEEKEKEEDAYEGDSEEDKNKKGKEKKKGGRRKSQSDVETDKEKGKDKGKEKDAKDKDDGLAPYPVIVQKGAKGGTEQEERYESAVETQNE